MIAVVDYGMGNIASVTMALKHLGYEVCVTDDIELLEKASHIILPGVGSFPAAMEEIDKRGLREPLKRLAERTPFLGICLGMQLLFSIGEEGEGVTEGLDLIPGRVVKIKTDEILPHMGWNTLQINPDFPAFNKVDGKYVYFVHSYGAITDNEYIVATSEYGTDVTAIVKRNQIYGMQFHPEKSAEIGQELLKLFLKEGVVI